MAAADSCLDRDPDDEEAVVETALHPAMVVASFLVVEGLPGEVVVALKTCAPFGPFLVPCCFAAVVVEVVAAVKVAAVKLMLEAWEAMVVVQPC